jgi:hypothetical protein
VRASFEILFIEALHHFAIEKLEKKTWRNFRNFLVFFFQIIPRSRQFKIKENKTENKKVLEK